MGPFFFSLSFFFSPRKTLYVPREIFSISVVLFPLLVLVDYGARFAPMIYTLVSQKILSGVLVPWFFVFTAKVCMSGVLKNARVRRAASAPISGCADLKNSYRVNKLGQTIVLSIISAIKVRFLSTHTRQLRRINTIILENRSGKFPLGIGFVGGSLFMPLGA